MWEETEISGSNSHPTEHFKQASGSMRQALEGDVGAGDLNVS